MAPHCFTVIPVTGRPKTRNAWLSMFENRNNWQLESTLGITPRPGFRVTDHLIFLTVKL